MKYRRAALCAALLALLTLTFAGATHASPATDTLKASQAALIDLL
jgi:hypothetical protein